ncbi:hypothetical protein CHARACLAT_006742 [Characodon lateralis]|uniref:Uncharacterized protein n=1 Tax=Characodon lateralis TaxID=208331 RepID=A0ABU7DYK4_9TELE|nr:hypothetical protein [Characodon lateralis]
MRSGRRSQRRVLFCSLRDGTGLKAGFTDSVASVVQADWNDVTLNYHSGLNTPSHLISIVALTARAALRNVSPADRGVSEAEKTKHRRGRQQTPHYLHSLWL